MELLGLKVRHERLGVGMITQRAGNLIIVTYPARHGKKMREYISPDAFETEIEAENIAVQQAMLDRIREARAAAQIHSAKK